MGKKQIINGATIHMTKIRQVLEIKKTYDRIIGSSLEPFDMFCSDLLCGEIQLGDIVQIWDGRRYYIGIAELYGGQPSCHFIKYTTKYCSIRLKHNKFKSTRRLAH